MRGCRKILIAIDGSADVLRHGIRLAQDEKTWITVLKVIPPFEGDLNLTGIKSIEDVIDSGARKAVSEIRNTAEDEGIMIKTRIEEGKIDKKIVEVAQEERCDLIILGAKKRKGVLSRLFDDHVIEKVISRAPCPVYLVNC